MTVNEAPCVGTSVTWRDDRLDETARITFEQVYRSPAMSEIDDETLDFAIAITQSHFENALEAGDNFDERWTVEEMEAMVAELKRAKEERSD